MAHGFYLVTIDYAVIEDEMRKMARCMGNVRGRSTLQLVRNYFIRIFRYCNICKKYKYVDTVTVYVSHSKKNIVFRRTVVVNLIMIYLRRTV